MARTPKSSGGRRPAFESDVSRRPGTRRGRERLLIVCDGEVTEPDYLRGLVSHLSNPAVTVRVKTKSCSPTQLVAYAAGERDRSREDFDQVWCVFDVDEYDVAEAVRAARRAGIHLAVSNPCFELWLILHFRTHTTHAAGYKELVPHLKRHVPGYDKARLDFRDYEGGWRDAGRRARALAEAGQEHLSNPSTGMWALVDRIAGE